MLQGRLQCSCPTPPPGGASVLTGVVGGAQRSYQNSSRKTMAPPGGTNPTRQAAVQLLHLLPGGASVPTGVVGGARCSYQNSSTKTMAPPGGANPTRQAALQLPHPPSRRCVGADGGGWGGPTQLPKLEP
jgi:hypothetical protein